ncbi:MAG: thioredoxin domain-containing protein [Gemmatimonadaceae bacterium]|nr:thioredoxin domain-containing protein [Gemmatimonadaceae bacterium]
MRFNESFLNLMTAVATTCAVVVTSVVVYRQVHVTPIAGASANPARERNRIVVDWKQQVAAGRRMGPANAPVTILYYGDFECPACRAFAKVVEALRTAHPAEVSVIFRHSPLAYHRFAYSSARAAECAADQGRFEPMYKVLYAAQDSLGLVPYAEFARRIAVPDAKRFGSCMAAAGTVARIERDREAAQKTNIPGTPGIIIDGTLFSEKIPSAADLEDMVIAAARRAND